MKHFSLYTLVTACCWVALATPRAAYSQKVINQKDFHIQGYDIERVGYPKQLVPGKPGQMLYLEFWRQGVEGRPFDNFYLQSYDMRSMTEIWYKPVTNEGFEEMKVSDLIRLNQGVFVLGQQYIDTEKRFHTMGRFFDFDGKPLDSEPIKISNYDEKTRKEVKELIVTSPAGKAMLWCAYDGRRYYASAWTGNGIQQWSKEINVPIEARGFVIKSAVIDEGCNAYFLLAPEKPSLTGRDCATPEVLLRFDTKKDTTVGHLPLKLDSLAFPLHSFLRMTESGDPIYAGVASGDGIAGLNSLENVDELDQGAKVWTHLFFHRLHYEVDLKVTKQIQMPIPQTFLDRYKGHQQSHFARVRIETEGKLISGVQTGTCFLLMEEFYTEEKKKVYGNVGIVAFDLEKGLIRWMRFVDKKQRTSGTGTVLSFSSCVSRAKLRLVYLTQLGAPGRLACTSLDVLTGELATVYMANNQQGNFLFFPSNSSLIGITMLLVGMGAGKDDYRVTTIMF